MIEQLAQAFRRLSGRIKTDEPAEVRRDLDESLKEMTGLDFNVLDSLPMSSVLEVFGSHAEPDPARTLAVADCSYVRAQLSDLQHQPELSLRSRVMALTMYLEALSIFRHELMAPAEVRLEALVKELKNVDLPHETALRLFRYRAGSGRFADAENALFDILESRSFDRGMVEEGKVFYQHLLSLPDSELEGGNLPRAEVIEALSELEGLL